MPLALRVVPVLRWRLALLPVLLGTMLLSFPGTVWAWGAAIVRVHPLHHSAADPRGTCRGASGGATCHARRAARPALVNDFTIDTTATLQLDQQLGLCANACYAGTTSYTTVPYYTLNTPQAAQLVYHEDRAHPRPVLTADVTPTSGSAVPTQYIFRATLNGTTVTFLTGDTLLYFSGASSTVRLAGQFNAGGYATGVYPLVVTVTAVYSGGGTVPHTYSQLFTIVNENASPIASGWTVGGVQRLYFTASAYLITDGYGSAVRFSGLGVQAADYSVLTYVTSGSYYVRTYLDNSRTYFDASGYMTERVTPLGVKTFYGFNTSHQLTYIVDQQRQNRGFVGTYLSFTYGTYGLSAISEVGGVAGRTTNITVASDGTLRTIKDPDSDSSSYAYDANGQLATVTDRRGGVTSYTYDGHSGKLTQLTLPAIPVDAGGGTTTTGSPKIKYTPWMTLGVPTVATSSSAPATPVAASAIHATITDPIGRVTTVTVDRWGQPLVVTDPTSQVTTITRSGFLPVKVTYPSGGTDTLAYVAGMPLVNYLQTAGDSVIHYHYGARNQVDSVWGPGLRAERRFLDTATGRVDSIRYASSNTLIARFTYDSTNRLLTRTDPGRHTTSYHYDAISGNADSISRPGNLYAIARFDAHGRDTADRAAGAVVWTRTAYDTLNRALKIWHPGRTNDTTSLTYDVLFPVRVQTPGGAGLQICLQCGRLADDPL